MAEKQDIKHELLEYLGMNFEAMRDDQTLTDVVLACGDETFLAHKVLLASSCKFFYDLFVKSDVKDERELEVNGIFNAAVLKDVLDFIYTGNFNIPQNDPAALELLLVVAKEMQFDLMVKYMCQIVLKEWNDPIPCLMKLAKDLELYIMNRFISTEVADMYGDDLNSERFLELPIDIFASILSKPELDIEMDERLKKILEWVEHDQMERIKSFPELFVLINIKEISEDYLMQLPSNIIIMSNMVSMQTIMKELSSRLQAAKSASMSTVSSRSASPFHVIDVKGRLPTARSSELIHEKDTKGATAAAITTKTSLRASASSYQPIGSTFKPIDRAPLAVKSMNNLPPVAGSVSATQGKQTPPLEEVPKDLCKTSVVPGFQVSSRVGACCPTENQRPHQAWKPPPKPNNINDDRSQNRGKYPPGPERNSRFAEYDLPKAVHQRVAERKNDIEKMNLGPVADIIESRNRQFERNGPVVVGRNSNNNNNNNNRNPHYERNMPKPELGKIVVDDEPKALVTVTNSDDDERSFLQVFTIGAQNGPIMLHSEALNNFPRFFSMASNDECIYFLGGTSSNWVSVTNNTEYDIRTKQWKERKPMNYPRYSTGSCFFQEQLYVIGGIGDQNTRINTVERYDLKTDSWTTMPSTNCRYESPCVTATEAFLFTVGGYPVEDQQAIKRQLKPQPYAMCEYFDTRMNQWTKLDTKIPVGTQVNEMCFCVVTVGDRTFVINKNFSKMPSPSGENMFHFLFDSSLNQKLFKRRTFEANLQDIVAIGLCKGKIYILDETGQMVIYNPEKTKTDKIERLEKLSNIGYAIFMK